MNENLEVIVKITEYVFTPFSCSSFINQFLKCFLYQKTQIPYPYIWLKNSVSRRRNRSKAEENKPDGVDHFKIENQFRIASKLYDGLEDAMRELGHELCKNTVSEIYVLFGPTPLCPKEVCRIEVPTLASGHFEEVHVKDTLQHQHKALGQIFLSETWMDHIDSSIPCTNTFIFITKYQDDESEMKMFKSCKPLSFQRNVKQYSIKIIWDSSREYTCCKILNENNETCESEEVLNNRNQDRQSRVWYQFDHSLQGYKNLFINQKGVSELW